MLPGGGGVGRAPLGLTALGLTDTLLVLYSSCLLEGLFVCLKSFDCLMYLHLRNNNNNNINRGIFQGDSLSPLLFVLHMVPLSLVLRRSRAVYEWGDVSL